MKTLMIISVMLITSYQSFAKEDKKRAPASDMGTWTVYVDSKTTVAVTNDPFEVPVDEDWSCIATGFDPAPPASMSLNCSLKNIQGPMVSIKTHQPLSKAKNCNYLWLTNRAGKRTGVEFCVKSVVH